jgi:PAS domain S-box-containing protein
VEIGTNCIVRGKYLDPTNQPQMKLVEFMRLTDNVSKKIHGVLNEREIFNILKEEFSKSKKYDITILLTNNDRTKLDMEETSLILKNLKKIQKITGLGISKYNIELNKSKIFNRVVNDCETFEVKTGDIISEILPTPFAYLVTRMIGLVGKNTVVTPLNREGKIVGALAISSSEQTEHLMLPVKNLAQNISISLELIDRHNDLLKTEKALEQERNKAQKYLDAAGLITLFIDVNGFVQSINRKGSEFLGYTMQEIVGKNWIDNFLPEKSREHVRMIFTNIVQDPTESNSHYENSVLTRKDGERFLTWNGIRLEDSDGKVIGILNSGNDITEHKKTEDELRASQRTLSSLMSNLSGMMYRRSNDNNWTMSFVSDGCFDLTGYLPSDFVKNKISYSQLVHSRDKKKILDAIQKSLTESKSFKIEYRIFTANGEMKWVWEEGHVISSGTGSYATLEGYVTETTVRKKIEEELKKSEESFRKLAENASDIIFLYDLIRGYDYMSPACIKITGYTPEEFYADKNLTYRTVHPDDVHELTKMMEEVNKQRIPVQSEIRWRHKKGKIVWTEQTYIPIQDEKGDLIAFEGIVRDITERKQIEEDRRRFEDRLSALNFYGVTLNSAQNQQQVFDLTLNAVEKALGFEYAAFLIMDRGYLRLASQRGISRTLIKELPIDDSKRGIDIRAYNTRKAILVDDVWKDRDYVENIPGIRSKLVVPVEIEDRVIGVLNIQSKKVGAFDGRDMKLLQILASHAAAAISSKEKQAEIERRSNQLSSLMKSSAEIIHTTDLYQRLSVTANAIRDLGWRRVVITLRDENLEVKTLDDIVSSGLTNEERDFLWKNTPSPKVWRERFGPEYNRFKIGQFYYLPWSEPWVREKFSDNTVASRLMREEMVDWDPQDLLYAPLTLANGRIVGVLSIDDPVDGRRPTSESLAPLELFIHPAAVGIENAQLIRQLNNATSQIKEYADRLEQMVQQRTQELFEAQNKLIKSERLVAIGEIAAMVGHDLRNPLQVIIYTLYLCNEILKKAPQEVGNALQENHLEDLLSRIGEQVNYMNKIILDLQDYSKPLEPNIVETNILDLIKDTISNITVAENIKVAIKIPENFPRVPMDSSMMQRVFVNLANNAMQAMSDGGQLTFESLISDGTLTISVQDTGVGIPAENMDKLFQPLFTTKSKGQGFGLAVCKRIVEAHGGSISVASESGKGSIFTIKIPIGKLKYS